MAYTEFELLDCLKSVQDPEMGASIVELGLVYRAEQSAAGIDVDFTLTSPGCPLGEEIRTDIVLTLKKKTGIDLVRANIVWNPPWEAGMMSDELKLEFGYPIW
ncbi:MAG TPA: aromatic ring hydroxylase [Treponema sp.]|nr:MAG: aromatic ring hydroxylase [Treponema sp. GWA1_62_8]OHE67074.1 MAG: aromatic ring hydroxylase [Treponema sp. GWC1_61_84]OHE75246.1 MAG: aromatic ring hydroxylase [Treponema sp. RIFOXYC1_FULL_61_9]HCM26218.1 aromatic ring hydroxylase [Treponema sp.]